MSADEQEIPQPLELRLRPLYEEGERGHLPPGQHSTLNLRQARACIDAVGKARAQGRITVAIAEIELATLGEVLDRLHRNAPVVRAIPVRLAPVERELAVRPRSTVSFKEQRRRERKARKAARPAKKSKSRKRR